MTSPVTSSLLLPIKRALSEGDKARMELLGVAAQTHLDRANRLAQVEWNVTLLFWGALLTSGISFIAFASRSSPPLAIYIAHYDWVFLTAYFTAAAIFIFGFSINQARSVIEARGQYQLALNAAHMIASLEPIARTGGAFPKVDPDLSYSRMTRNIVWKTKLLSTFLFASGIWAVTQILAHGNISLARKIPAEQINLACAFLACHDDNRVNLPYDHPELGSLIWLAVGALVIWLWSRHSRPEDR